MELFELNPEKSFSPTPLQWTDRNMLPTSQVCTKDLPWVVLGELQVQKDVWDDSVNSLQENKWKKRELSNSNKIATQGNKVIH